MQRMVWIAMEPQMNADEGAQARDAPASADESKIFIAAGSRHIPVLLRVQEIYKLDLVSLHILCG
jgi:hypothetical protein